VICCVVSTWDHVWYKKEPIAIETLLGTPQLYSSKCLKLKQKLMKFSKLLKEGLLSNYSKIESSRLRCQRKIDEIHCVFNSKTTGMFNWIFGQPYFISLLLRLRFPWNTVTSENKAVKLPALKFLLQKIS